MGWFLFLFRCLESYNSASVWAILDGPFISFLVPLLLFTALFTMCDWIEVLGGVGTTKSGVAYCFCVTFVCSLTDFPLELHVVFSFFILYSFITLYWIGFQKLLLAGSDVLYFSVLLVDEWVNG